MKHKHTRRNSPESLNELHQLDHDDSNVLSKHHFIFTPENPKGPLKFGKNPSVEDLRDFLNKEGEDAHITDGKYDGKNERSIIVHNPKNVKGLHQMAADFGQESALHSVNGKHQLHYYHRPDAGRIVTGEGTMFHKTPPEDNYTKLSTPQGPMYFTHNLDFDNGLTMEERANQLPLKGKKVVIHDEEDLGKSELLEKTVKDMKNMLGPNLTPEHQDHIKWASKLPNSNWQMWTTRHFKNKPQEFTPAMKQQIEHFSGSQHIPEIAKIRFDKAQDVPTGLTMLKDAETNYNKRIVKDLNLVKPTATTKVETNVPGEKSHWFDLGVGSSKAEGKAMGHCGNVPDEAPGDRVFSLRTPYTVNGKTMHEPHLTFVNNNGFLGEMKGRGNEKPAKHYHKHIVELLKDPKIKGIIGGGYAEENNFSFNDLSPEHQNEVLQANPNLITSADDHDKILNKSLPNKFRHVRLAIAENPNVDPKHHKKLVNDEDPEVRRVIALNPSLDPKHHEELVNDCDRDVRRAIAENPNVDPKHHEKLVNDQNYLVRRNIAKNPNVDPKHHEKLANDQEYTVRQAIAENPSLDPKHHEKLVNDQDSDVRRAIAKNPTVDPKHHEKLVNDQDSYVREAIAKNPSFKSINKAEDILANQLTSQKGVSDRGIEVRRADKKQKGIIAHGYARTSSPEFHANKAKNYFKDIGAKLKAQAKPNLTKNELTVEFEIYEIIEKAFYPDQAGQIDPLTGNIAKMHPTLNTLMMHASSQRVAAHDAALANPVTRKTLLDKITSPNHKAAMVGVINRTASDPNRHFIPTLEHGKHVLRARHIKSLLLGDPNYTIDTSKPDFLKVTAKERHGQDTRPTEWNFPIKIKGAVDGQSIKKHDQSRIDTFSRTVFRLRIDVNGRGDSGTENLIGQGLSSTNSADGRDYSDLTKAQHKITVEPFTAEPHMFDPKKHDFIARYHVRGKPVSFIAITHKKNGIMPFNFWTQKKHRGKRYGEALIHHATSISNKPILLSPDMTPAAKGLAAKLGLLPPMKKSEDDQITLFVYGKLKPQYDPPDSMSNPRPDSVKGTIHDLGRDAALKLGHGTADGFTMEVSQKELKDLNHYEAPEFKLVEVTTNNGDKAWTYEYQKDVPNKEVEDWEEKSFGKSEILATISYLMKSVNPSHIQHNMILLHPMTIGNKSTRENGMPIHMTMKNFGDARKLNAKPSDVMSLLDRHNLHLPIDVNKLIFTPHKLKGLNGEEHHVLLIHGMPNRLRHVQESTKHMGPNFQHFLPHISIDKEDWDKYNKIGSALSAKDIGVKIHPAELKIGSQTLKAY